MPGLYENRICHDHDDRKETSKTNHTKSLNHSITRRHIGRETKSERCDDRNCDGRCRDSSTIECESNNMFWDEESESDDCDISDDEYRSDIEPMDEPITREEESDTNTESNEEAHDESIDTSF